MTLSDENVKQQKEYTIINPATGIKVGQYKLMDKREVHDTVDEARKNFSRVCFEQGYDLTQTEQRIIKNLDLDHFVPLADRLDKGVKRCRIMKRLW